MTDPFNAPNADRTICSVSRVMPIILDANNVHSIPRLETPMTPLERTLCERGVNHRAHSKCNCHQRQRTSRRTRRVWGVAW